MVRIVRQGTTYRIIGLVRLLGVTKRPKVVGGGRGCNGLAQGAMNFCLRADCVPDRTLNECQ